MDEVNKHIWVYFLITKKGNDSNKMLKTGF